MSCKLLERSVKVECEIPDSVHNSKFELEYYLLENDITDLDTEDQKSYGVEIVKRLSDGSTETKRFENIYTCKEKVLDLIGKLAANTVTPVSLPYILEDLIGV